MSSFFTTKRKAWLGAIAVLLVLNCFAWRDLYAFAGPGHLEVSVLNIGQGDAIFIETPSFRRILIDGGPDSTILGKLQSRLPFWEKTIDIVILSHPDADHLNGLLSVLKRYHVKNIIWTGIDRNGATYQEWLELLLQEQRRGAKVFIANKGDSILNGAVRFEMLHPFESLEGQFYDKQGNETGVVVKLRYGDRTFLFTADTSSAVEQQLADSHVDISADVLKVGHHGSKFSTSEAFLDVVHPQIAAISVGAKNTYGHPTAEVLQRLQDFGITVLRTDRSGDIEFTTDGKTLQYELSHF